jgi:hypothetical protein
MVSIMADLPEKIRAFIAIRAGAEVERAIIDLIARLHADHDGIRWVSSSNLHLTAEIPRARGADRKYPSPPT